MMRKIADGEQYTSPATIDDPAILGEMERENHKLGLVILCIGGGQGIAMLLERD
jgi:Thiolase, C-terminal domain